VSVDVPIEALDKRIEEFGSAAFLITINIDGHAHVASTQPRLEGGVLVVEAGRTSRANAAANPSVTLLWPRSSDGAYSLIVDATTVDGDHDGAITAHPVHAVLHRLVDANGDGP
jgi:hypothetical protein